MAPAFIAGNKENAKRPKDVGKWCDIDYFDGLRDPRGYKDVKYDRRKGYGLSWWSDNKLEQMRGWIEKFGVYTYLELGCGKGWNVQAMRMQGVEAYGVDISEYATKSCHPDMERYIHCQDASDLSRFKDNYFDLVFSWDFLEHLLPDEIAKCLKECRRVGRKWMNHGITIFTENYGSIAEKFPKEPQDPTHVSCYRIDFWQEMFEGIFPNDEVEFEVSKPVGRRLLGNITIKLKKEKEIEKG